MTQKHRKTSEYGFEFDMKFSKISRDQREKSGKSRQVLGGKWSKQFEHMQVGRSKYPLLACHTHYKAPLKPLVINILCSSRLL